MEVVLIFIGSTIWHRTSIPTFRIKVVK